MNYGCLRTGPELFKNGLRMVIGPVSLVDKTDFILILYRGCSEGAAA
jgi:hypothetical protein